MVYVKRVKLAHFKSFGGTVEIDLESGFTVVTGPNGSGKSNIIDGILFCLGLTTSRGMRAERLPDLINNRLVRNGKAAEAAVSVVFALDDWQPPEAEGDLEPPEEGPWVTSRQAEVTFTRRIRLAPGGTYSSSYAITGEACNLQQVQTQLRRLRIDPAGSNVVMQGDVTRIVSMSARERREMIDELAGVALFDRRIEQSRSKLDTVREHEEHCRIVEAELQAARRKLERDCEKARLYKQLREQVQQGRLHEQVLQLEVARAQCQELVDRQHKVQHEQQALVTQREQLGATQQQRSKQLAVLQDEVKQLGEDKLLAVQAELGGVDGRQRGLQRSREQQAREQAALHEHQHGWRQRSGDLEAERGRLAAADDTGDLAAAEQCLRLAEAAVEQQRKRMGEVAGRSGAWMESQQQQLRTMADLRQQIAPLLTEQSQLQERLHQERQRLHDWQQEQNQAEDGNRKGQQQLETLTAKEQQLQQTVQATLREQRQCSDALALQQRTRERLEQEQVQLERDLTRLESRREALQESRGTAALRLLLESSLPGIHGPVAQLGEVDEHHRLALDVAAGSRLGHVVVDDDQIAAEAIAVLKRRKAGRLTFLPLNRIRPQAGKAAMLRGDTSHAGLVDRAVSLVRFEPIYAHIFAHVLGDTLVFEHLDGARRLLGRHRCVTLGGELLERSGAMTGGTVQRRSDGLGFGRREQADDAEPMRKRLLELGEALVACRRGEAEQRRALAAVQPRLETVRCQQAAAAAEKTAAQQRQQPALSSLQQRRQRMAESTARISGDEARLAERQQRLSQLQQQLAAMEAASEQANRNLDTQQWQRLQHALDGAEAEQTASRNHRDGLLAGIREQELARQRLADQHERLQQEDKQLGLEAAALADRQQALAVEQQQLEQQRQALQQQQQELTTVLGERRLERDKVEAEVADLHRQQQQADWRFQQLTEQQQGWQQQQEALERQIEQRAAALPQPLPELPDAVRADGLEALQQHLRGLQQKLEAMEPVNMLALEELEQLQVRLGEIEERLAVLCREREELLLRIETVGTLRQEAFMEAYRAVNTHFGRIFAQLSDGEGHLQLENEADPLAGGLTLVAHPRGKTLRRLASMSGGEKSMTALSFLFALQRFRPSPFYALDEVDSFLDGVNVERLAALIGQQSGLAQFLVVSHRRPMIGAAERTIGVTQARGAHTQVVGLPVAAA